MKILMFTIMLAALTAGMARAGYDYSACAHNNSKACTDDRNAFASHHGGVYPEQYSQNHHRNKHHFWNKDRNQEHRDDQHR